MAAYEKRITFAVPPEWAEELDQLKREQFYNETMAEMFRYIISRGLETLMQEKSAKGEGDERAS